MEFLENKYLLLLLALLLACFAILIVLRGRKKNKFMFDSNVFDDIVNGKLELNELKKKKIQITPYKNAAKAWINHAPTKSSRTQEFEARTRIPLFFISRPLKRSAS